MRALGSIRTPRGLLCLAGAVWALLLLGAFLVQPSDALFTAQSTVPANTFTTASCFAGNTGLLSPAAQAADTSAGNGDGYELNPAGAFASGGSFATDVGSGGDRHRYYNYNISIPAGCSIKGIVVRIDWWLSNTSGNSSMGIELSWNSGTSYTAAKTDAVMTTTQHTALLGGSTDLWGRTWTVAETSNANFRVRVTDNNTTLPDFMLDWIPVQVYYGP